MVSHVPQLARQPRRRPAARRLRPRGRPWPGRGCATSPGSRPATRGSGPRSWPATPPPSATSCAPSATDLDEVIGALDQLADGDGRGALEVLSRTVGPGQRRRRAHPGQARRGPHRIRDRRRSSSPTRPGALAPAAHRHRRGRRQPRGPPPGARARPAVRARRDLGRASRRCGRAARLGPPSRTGAGASMTDAVALALDDATPDGRLSATSSSPSTDRRVRASRRVARAVAERPRRGLPRHRRDVPRPHLVVPPRGRRPRPTGRRSPRRWRPSRWRSAPTPRSPAVRVGGHDVTARDPGDAHLVGRLGRGDQPRRPGESAAAPARAHRRVASSGAAAAWPRAATSPPSWRRTPTCASCSRPSEDARLARRTLEIHGGTDADSLAATRDQIVRRDRDDSHGLPVRHGGRRRRHRRHLRPGPARGDRGRAGRGPGARSGLKEWWVRPSAPQAYRSRLLRDRRRVQPRDRPHYR